MGSGWTKSHGAMVGEVLQVVEILSGPQLQIWGRLLDNCFVTLRTRRGRCLFNPAADEGIKPCGQKLPATPERCRSKNLSVLLQPTLQAQCTIRAGLQSAEWCFFIERNQACQTDPTLKDPLAENHKKLNASKKVSVELPEVVCQISNMGSVQERLSRHAPEPLKCEELNGLLFEIVLEHIQIELIKSEEVDFSLRLGALRVIDSKNSWDNAAARQRDSAIPIGTRVIVDGHGAGRVVQFSSKALGPNEHTIVFDSCSSCRGKGQGCSLCRRSLPLKDLSYTIERQVQLHEYRQRMDGWLQKQGGVRKNWLKRYFVFDPEVHSNFIAYYEDYYQRSCKGKIYLNDVIDARCSTAPTAVKHEFEISTSKRVYRFVRSQYLSSAFC
eukprot:SAG31_NODE_840_length_11596_cov_3.056623_3_plen_384_part_00